MKEEKTLPQINKEDIDKIWELSRKCEDLTSKKIEGINKRLEALEKNER